MSVQPDDSIVLSSRLHSCKEVSPIGRIHALNMKMLDMSRDNELMMAHHYICEAFKQLLALPMSPNQVTYDDDIIEPDLFKHLP